MELKFAARACFDYLFNVKGIRRIYAYVEDYNLSSQRLCEKLGMLLGGHMKKHFGIVYNIHPSWK